LPLKWRFLKSYLFRSFIVSIPHSLSVTDARRDLFRMPATYDGSAAAV
jgi:hypothetical protein